MQTFLPYPDFQKSAQALDNKRLGKQRVEAYTILHILLGETESKAWRNHPAVLMWKGYEKFLFDYTYEIINEWKQRGFNDNMELKVARLQNRYEHKLFYSQYPYWLGRDSFHNSHRSNLLRKDPEHYGQFGWKEPNDLPYWWPTKHD